MAMKESRCLPVLRSLVPDHGDDAEDDAEDEDEDEDEAAESDARDGDGF
jgi:hypothetical protein